MKSNLIVSVLLAMMVLGCRNEPPSEVVEKTIPQVTGASYKAYKIAFVYQAKDIYKGHLQVSDICVVNHDGTGFANLTKGGLKGTCPRWTPDRTKIVFLVRAKRSINPTWGSHQRWDSYQVNADGTGLKSVDYFYVWSRYGRQRAFVSVDDGNQNIYSICENESSARRVTDYPGNQYTPAWSPDGTKMAFVSDRGRGSHIHVVNADGTGSTQLTGNAWIFTQERYDRNPSWCDDGRRIVYVSNHCICTVNVDGSDERTLVKQAGIYSVSPDGRQIAYLKNTGMRMSIYPDFSLDLNVMDVDGGNRKRLTGDVSSGLLTMRSHSNSVICDLAWSPDGKKIVFPRFGALYTINADGTEERCLEIQDLCQGATANNLKISLINPSW